MTVLRCTCWFEGVLEVFSWVVMICGWDSEILINLVGWDDAMEALNTLTLFETFFSNEFSVLDKMPFLNDRINQQVAQLTYNNRARPGKNLFGVVTMSANCLTIILFEPCLGYFLVHFYKIKTCMYMLTATFIPISGHKLQPQSADS